ILTAIGALRRDHPTYAPVWLSLGEIDIAVAAPIFGEDFVDDHIGRGLRVGWALFDTVDRLVDAFNDYASLLWRQRACRHINSGGRHPILRFPMIHSYPMPNVKR